MIIRVFYINTRGLMKKTTKTMTLNLSYQEMEAIETLAKKKGMNKTAVVRQAIRLYQTINVRLENGEKIFFEDTKKDKSELVLL